MSGGYCYYSVENTKGHCALAPGGEVKQPPKIKQDDSLLSVELCTMKPSLVTLSCGQSPRTDILPLLLEHLPEEQIVHVGLLDDLTHAQIERQYAPDKGGKMQVIRLNDGSQVCVSAEKITTELQQRILILEECGYDTILLLCSGDCGPLYASTAVLLEPDRLVPPLVKAIVGGHQVGIVVSVAGQIHAQKNKWKNLKHPPCFAVASPYHANDEPLIEAALSLQEQGADVVVLDCMGYHPRHRDFLQALLGIPVLLSNMLIARLAAELLV